MSKKSTKRFDKYIPLFGKDDDERVTLLLGELEDNAKEKMNKDNRSGYKSNDIGLDTVTSGLQNQYFSEPESDKNDTDVHYEWKIFMLQLGNRLGNTDLDSKHLDIIKELQKAKSGSVEEFMLYVFDKIATFEVEAGQVGQVGQVGQAVQGRQAGQVVQGRQAVPKSFIDNKSQLADVSKVTFKSSNDIINVLTNNVVLDTSTKYGLVRDGLNIKLSTGFVLNADSNITKDSFSINIKLMSQFNEYIKTPAGAQIFPRNPIRADQKRDTIIGILMAFLDYLDNQPDFKYFNYNLDKYLRNKLFSTQQSVIPVSASSFFDTPVVDQGKYWRQPDGSLWTINTKGERECVDITCDKFKQLKYTDKCFGTNFIDSKKPGGKSCAEYLRECLSGNDVSKCVTYLKDENYWSNVETEVNEMLPAIALKTLESFEFNTVETYDETNKVNILKVISVEKWLTNLQSMINSTTNTKVTSDDYLAISKNEKLKGYLELLVKKINSNPQILNKGLIKSDEQNRYNPNAFAESKLARMGIKPRIATTSFAPSSVERLADSVRNVQNDVAVRFRLTGPNIFGGILSGGSGIIDDLEDKLGNETKQTWSIFKSHYLALQNQLKSMGKDIVKEDQQKVETLFDQLQKSETKLLQLILLIQKYKDLISIHGERDTSNTLRVDNIKQFVDQRNKYFMRVTKKQNDLISIIKAIADAVQQESPTKTEPLADPKEEKLYLARLM